MGIIELVWQVTTYTKIYPSGYHRLILGRTTILPVNHATTDLQLGSFREIRSKIGKSPRLRVPFYGFTGNVC
jgi:hypothetical protein